MRLGWLPRREQLPAPIAPAVGGDKRPPNRTKFSMVRSPQTPVWGELSVVLIFPLEAGISWSAPELLYLRVVNIISKITNI